MAKKTKKTDTKKTNPLIEAAEPNPADLLQSDRERRTAKLAYDALAKQYKASLERIELLTEANNTLTQLDKRKPQKAYKPIRSKTKSEATAIVNFSDWHCEEVVQQDSENGLTNEYNLGIAERRAKAVTERVLMQIEHERGLANIQSLILALSGDFITGWIHKENRETNALSPPKATMFATDLFEKTCKTIQERSGCKYITAPCSVGNHDRITEKSQSSNAEDTSYATMIYHNLRKRFSEWDWRISNSYHKIVQVSDYRLRFSHGDGIKYQGGIGGMTIPVTKRILRLNNRRKAHFDFFGHLHQYCPSNMFCCNGSLIGYNAYAERNAFDEQEPLQTFAVCDHKRGITKVTQLFAD